MKNKSRNSRRRLLACLAALAILPLAACAGRDSSSDLIFQDREEKRIVNFFSPMEKMDPNAENVARTASDLTVAMAEEVVLRDLVYH